MSPFVPRRPGAPSALSGRMMALGVVALAVVIVGALMALGVVDLSRFRSVQPTTAGLIAVPTPSTKIPAYGRVRRDHLWDRANGRLAMIYLPPQAVTKEMIVDISDIIGRVLDHEKEPGYVFTAADFLPEGTREGIVAGIPAGKRAIRIAADRVDGLYGLRAGDRFDILATMPIDAAGGGRAFNLAGPYSQEVALQAQLSNWDKQATVRVIVQSAVIVEPMTTRGVPTQGSAADGGATRTRPVQEAVIAIEPDEVALLTEAMAVDARLTTIPRSGRPDDPVDSETPDLRPFSPFTTQGGGSPGGVDSRVSADQDDAFTVVETIMGQKRSRTAVPKP